MTETSSNHNLIAVYGCAECGTRCLTWGKGDRAGHCPQSFCKGTLDVFLVSRESHVGSMDIQGEA